MDFLTFIGVVVLVFGVLQIILFFKIWGMTNDVERIYNLLNKSLSKRRHTKIQKTSVDVNYDGPLRPNELSISEFVNMKDKQERGYLKADWSTKTKDYAEYRNNFDE